MGRSPHPLPTGTVTFLFTDIEGSTRLLQELAPAYQQVQDEHAVILRKAISHNAAVLPRRPGGGNGVATNAPSGCGRVHGRLAR
jgi:class 3 adenylate cyclase